VRIKAGYVPEFKGPIEGYLVNSITREGWRVAETHDRDDLMQEGYLVFIRCAARYPLLDTAKHFMALFKRAWANHVNDLSTKATRARQVGYKEPEDWLRRPVEQIGETDNAGVLAAMVRQAPREVMLVLNLFLSAPNELLALAMRNWDESKPEQLNERLCQLLGFPAGTPLVEKVRDYFH